MDEPMTLQQVVSLLDAAGATFWRAPNPDPGDPAGAGAGGDVLGVSAPPGAPGWPLPAALDAAVRRYKGALLEVAEARGRVAGPDGWFRLGECEWRPTPDGRGQTRLTPEAEAAERARQEAALARWERMPPAERQALVESMFSEDVEPRFPELFDPPLAEPWDL